MLMMMTISISTSMIFLFIKHPLSMGLTLLIQATMVSLITGLYNHNLWFSYILFLIMIGGMLVLFIYMTSIASNEMFKYSNKLTIFIFMVTVMTTIFMMMSDQMIINQLMFNMDSTMFNNQETFKLSLNKYLNFPSNFILFFMILYLFVTMIAVVKITCVSYGPLRQKS